MTRTMSLAGTTLDIVERGECRRLLFCILARACARASLARSVGNLVPRLPALA
jgi:hypothetical protein